MSQYSKLFTTCRIPDTPRDRLELPDENNPSQHIIVIYNNHVREETSNGFHHP